MTSLRWRRGLVRWEVLGEGGEVLGSVTDRFLSEADEHSWELERTSRGWPPVPFLQPDPRWRWDPWTPGEVVAILDRGEEGLVWARASAHSRLWGPAYG